MVVGVHVLGLLVERFEVNGVELSVGPAFLVFVADLPALGDFAALVGHLPFLTAIYFRNIISTWIGREGPINRSILIENARLRIQILGVCVGIAVEVRPIVCLESLRVLGVDSSDKLVKEALLIVDVWVLDDL